jgi:hypothetical protein
MPSAVLSAGPVPGELAARIAAGPAFWTDWLGELDRDGLLAELPGPDAIGRALAEAPGSGRYDPALNPKMTLVCVLAGCLFPGEGYDRVLARVFAIPGLRFWPWPVPTASALSQARERLGEHAVRRLFETGAEAGDAELGLSALWHGLEVTAIDGTTLELDRNDVLACEFGSSSEACRPLLRIVGHVRVGRGMSAEAAAQAANAAELAGVGDQITSNQIENLERRGTLPDSAWIIARLDYVYQLDGYLGIEHTLNSITTKTKVGQNGVYAIRFPDFWAGRVWLQLRAPDEAGQGTAEGVLDLYWDSGVAASS